MGAKAGVKVISVLSDRDLELKSECKGSSGFEGIEYSCIALSSKNLRANIRTDGNQTKGIGCRVYKINFQFEK